VQRAINRLLRYPHLGRHLQDLALLVLDDQTLCAFEASGGCKERAVHRKSEMLIISYAMQQRFKRKTILTHAESLSDHFFLFPVLRVRKAHSVSPRV